MPGWGTFENTLEMLADNIDNDPELVEKLLFPIDKFPYFNMDDLDQEEFKKVVQATCQAYQKILYRWTDYVRFANYGSIRLLAQLKYMMLFDPRSGQQPSDEIGVIRLNSETVWQAVGWIYDFILEHMVAWWRDEQCGNDTVLAFELLEIWEGQQRRLDLSEWDAQRFCRQLPMIDDIYKWYGSSHDGRGMVSHSSAVLGALAPRVVELNDLFRSDPRFSTCNQQQVRDTKFQINYEAAWMPESGTFNLTLEMLADNIDDDPQLVEKLLFPIGKFHFFGMDDLNQQEFDKVTDATCHAYNEILYHWGDSGYNFADYDSIRLLAELKYMMLFDSRNASKPNGKSGTILLNSKTVWQTTGWIYDLLLEHMVAWWRDKRKGNDTALASELLANWEGQQRELDLSEWDTERFCRQMPMIDDIYRWYGDCHDGRGRVSYSPAVVGALVPRVVELNGLFRSDPRFSACKEKQSN
ncbi:MAG: hypothetical protein K8L99_33240 [Anaerolineae bacterium]|nr:hypothetical protein [Anaerolineae bacterium]